MAQQKGNRNCIKKIKLQKVIDNCINLRISILKVMETWQYDMTAPTTKKYFIKGSFLSDAEYDESN